MIKEKGMTAQAKDILTFKKRQPNLFLDTETYRTVKKELNKEDVSANTIKKFREKDCWDCQSCKGTDEEIKMCIEAHRKAETDIKYFETKRIAWDCPHCDNCLHIHIDSKGGVVDLTKAEQTITTHELRKHNPFEFKCKPNCPECESDYHKHIHKHHNKNIKFLAETFLEQQHQGQLCPQTMKKLMEVSKK